MTEETYGRIPETLQLRELRYTVVEKGRRTKKITVAETAAKSGAEKKHGSSGNLQNSERRGRRPNQDKIDQSDQHELVLANGFDLSQCDPVMDRPVWRIHSGKATLVMYERRRRGIE